MFKKYISNNQQRKAIYAKISGGKPLEPGLYRYGFLRRYYWVSNDRKASLVKDMTNRHLIDTLNALRGRHPDVNRKQLVFEYARRLKNGAIR